MLLFFFLFIILVVALLNYCITNKVRVHINTFTKKGFKRYKDDYGSYLFYCVQGGGKTFSVIDILTHYIGRKQIITNVRSFFENHKDSVTYEDNFENLISVLKSSDCSNVVVFYDEVFSLYKDNTMPESHRRFFTQIRKKHLTFFTTSQLWKELPSEFRRLMTFEVSCRMLSPWYLPFSILINEFNDASQIRWDSDQMCFVAPRLWTSIKKANLFVANSYDTYEEIHHARSDSTTAGNTARSGKKFVKWR